MAGVGDEEGVFPLGTGAAVLGAGGPFVLFIDDGRSRKECLRIRRKYFL
jgi:hypothetical protein